MSILPAHMLPAMQFPTLAAIPLFRPTIIRHVSLVSRADFVISPAAQRFIETARQVLPVQRIVDHRGDLPSPLKSGTRPELHNSPKRRTAAENRLIPLIR